MSDRETLGNNGADDDLSLPKDAKKTIAAEHVIDALKNYLTEVQEVLKEHKKLQKDRDKKSSRLENSGMTEEELLRQQELLFAQSRLKYQAQQQS
ncbi:3937_t:CDS:2 [Racocetra fulgida]|uniref:3937_t:CDS:1 n=1 Tax=Racocetra fulgida TaxID=60492 RepID=A0A9N9AXD3_9GLOM|nr:3937_t:CDS:2 [Racocetra fulgida]